MAFQRLITLNSRSCPIDRPIPRLKEGDYMNRSLLGKMFGIGMITFLATSCGKFGPGSNAASSGGGGGAGAGGNVPADARFGVLYSKITGLDFVGRGYPKTVTIKNASGVEQAVFSNTLDDKKRITAQTYTLASGVSDSTLADTSTLGYHPSSQMAVVFGVFASFQAGNSSKSGTRAYAAAGNGCPDWLENTTQTAENSTMSETFTCDGTKVTMTRLSSVPMNGGAVNDNDVKIVYEFDANFVVPIKQSITSNSKSGQPGNLTTNMSTTGTSEYTFANNQVSGFTSSYTSTGQFASTSSSTCALAETDLNCESSETRNGTTSTSTSVMMMQAARQWPWVNGWLTQVTKSSTVTSGTPRPAEEFDSKGRKTLSVMGFTSQSGTTYKYYQIEYIGDTLQASKITYLDSDKATVLAIWEMTW